MAYPADLVTSALWVPKDPRVTVVIAEFLVLVAQLVGRETREILVQVDLRALLVILAVLEHLVLRVVLVLRDPRVISARRVSLVKRVIAARTAYQASQVHVVLPVLASRETKVNLAGQDLWVKADWWVLLVPRETPEIGDRRAFPAELELKASLASKVTLEPRDHVALKVFLELVAARVNLVNVAQLVSLLKVIKENAEHQVLLVLLDVLVLLDLRVSVVCLEKEALADRLANVAFQV